MLTMQWSIIGFTLIFSEGNGYIGDFNYIFLNGLGTNPMKNYATTVKFDILIIN